MVREGLEGRRQVVPEEASQRRLNVQDVVMIADLNHQFKDCKTFDLLGYSGMIRVVHIYGEAVLYERVSESYECDVDLSKPPIYDDYGEDIEFSIVKDDKRDLDVLIYYKPPAFYVDPFLEFLTCPNKLPSLYANPFLVSTSMKVSKLNSRTSSFEEGVTDAGRILKKFSAVSVKQLFRSKRRIRGRIEGMSETGRILYDFGWKRRSKKNPYEHGHHPDLVKFESLRVQIG